MTRDAEDRTALDEAIDQVARTMVVGPTPDLRARVAGRLDTKSPRIAWWQPVVVTAILLIALLVWWPARNDAPRVAREQEPGIVPAPVPGQPTIERPSVTTETSSARPMQRARATRAAGAPWPEPTTVLPAIDMSPIPIEAIAVDRAAIARIELPMLAVEPLDVEPLSRENP
jgi:hypothetical protein